VCRVPPITNDDDDEGFRVVVGSKKQATWLLESGVEDTALVTP
jgi:hypothetical protein